MWVYLKIIINYNYDYRYITKKITKNQQLLLKFIGYIKMLSSKISLICLWKNWIILILFYFKISLRLIAAK